LTNPVDSFVHQKEKVIRYQKASLVDRAASRPPDSFIGRDFPGLDCICAIFGGIPDSDLQRTQFCLPQIRKGDFE